MSAAVKKAFFLLEFSGDRLNEIETLVVPVFQPMQILKGSLAEIEQQLTPFRHGDYPQPVWLDIEIATLEYLNDVQRHIEQLTADLPVEVLLIRRSREQRERHFASHLNETLSELQPDEVFARRLAQESLSEQQQTTLRQLFAQTLDGLNDDETST